MEMREKIARAIYEARNGRGARYWSALPGTHKAPYLADANAALTAIGETHVLVPREPTEEMYRAGEEQVGCHQIYAAMLAAVKEGE